MGKAAEADGNDDGKPRKLREAFRVWRAVSFGADVRPAAAGGMPWRGDAS
jgi:hypothetical protein